MEGLGNGISIRPVLKMGEVLGHFTNIRIITAYLAYLP
jgi:uncharacterized membrane protein AbrB (regulator of aidB expression)